MPLQTSQNKPETQVSVSSDVFPGHGLHATAEMQVTRMLLLTSYELRLAASHARAHPNIST